MEVRPRVREDENRACFLRLIDEYGPALRRLSNVYLERKADREDLFQEVAIALWQALPKFRGDASERTWLYRIAHNVAITASTKVNRRSRREDDLPESAPIPSPAPHAEQQLLQEEKRQLLERAIRSLPIVDREIILLHLEGLELFRDGTGKRAVRKRTRDQAVPHTSKTQRGNSEKGAQVMNGTDELRELWNTTPVPPVRREEVLATVQKRIKKFDRMIFMRNLRECAASLIVSAVFFWMALQIREPWQRAGAWILVVSGLFITFTLIRYGRSGKDPDAGSNLIDYISALMNRYDQQVRLLKNVKYWYLLPMYIGLVSLTIGKVLQESRAGAVKWPVLAMPIVYTVLFAWIWWLNEVRAVERLQRCNEKLLRMTDETQAADGGGR